MRFLGRHNERIYNLLHGHNFGVGGLGKHGVLRYPVAQHFWKLQFEYAWQSGSSVVSPKLSMSTADNRLLVVDYGKLLFLGRISAVPAHKCAATVIAFGLDREFELTTPRGGVLGRILMAEPGIVRSVNGFDGRMAVCLIDSGLEVDVMPDENATLSVLSRMTPVTVANEWPNFLKALRWARPPVDTRIAAAADTLRRSSSETVSAEAIATAVGLSISRLEHLFKEQIGAPMRSFRTWCRFRAAAEALARGCNFTEAAQEAGFFDQTHFTKTFRQWFGITPSFIFSSELSIHVVRGT